MPKDRTIIEGCERFMTQYRMARHTDGKAQPWGGRGRTDAAGSLSSGRIVSAVGGTRGAVTRSARSYRIGTWKEASGGAEDGNVRGAFAAGLTGKRSTRNARARREPCRRRTHGSRGVRQPGTHFTIR